GTGMGMFWVPPTGAGVWVEFEGGDPNYPIWSGCMFDSRLDVPLSAQKPGAPEARLVLQTPGRNSLVLSDVPSEGITLRAASGAEINISASGISITPGPAGAKIELVRRKVN